MNDRERYIAATHAMQSGVAMDLSHGASNLDPKHLRVGVNTAHVSHTALVEILVGLGCFTEEQYLTTLADVMEREQAEYEERLGVKLA